MEKILYGKPVADALNQSSLILLKKHYKGRMPELAVVRIGEDEASFSYIKGLLKLCEQLKIRLNLVRLESNISQELADKKILELSQSNQIDGILLQLPLPAHLNERQLIECIDVNKDVEGVTINNVGRFWMGQEAFAPCTAQAVMCLLDYYQIPLSGKKVTVFGRSQIVGKPLIQCFLKENATVSIAHSKTENAQQLALDSDIIISAVGKADFIQASWIKNQIVIDVGINFKDGKLCGDLAHEVYEKALAYTPVPKGIGVVTNAVLIHHVIKAYCRR